MGTGTLVYSLRSVATGSTRIARRVGIRHASTDTAITKATTVTRKTGSPARETDTTAGVTRDTAVAPSAPSSRPHPTCRDVPRATSQATWAVDAPSATRIPNSRLRRDTAPAVTA